MLTTAFNFQLGQQIHQGQVVIGKFDAKIPSLACSITGGKILLHSPHEGSYYADNQLPSIRMLNFNRKVTAMSVGALGASVASNRDLLVVGTQSNLLVYDVDRNSDLFFREVQDGVNSVAVGSMATMPKPLVIAGGNCSILGFDHEGNESFWTVTSDNISSMALCDVNGDGRNELVVGSDDFEIRAFEGEQIISETSENDKVSLLVAVPGSNNIAYGLPNGTVGVYSGLASRLWRVKTKHRPTSIMAFDVNGDGVAEIVSGWTNGSFNVRNGTNGEVLFRANVKSSVASVLHADYRLDGKEEIMVVTEAGDVRGYLPADAETTAMSQSSYNTTLDLEDSTGAIVTMPPSEDQRVLEELQAQKLQLINELKSLELAQAGASKGSSSSGDVASGGLPPDTNLSYALLPDTELGCLSLEIHASTDVQIINVIAIDTEGGVIEGSDVMVLSPPNPCGNARLALRPTKFQGSTLQLQTHLAVRSTLNQLHVFESTIKVPKFSMFKMVDSASSTDAPSSEIQFSISQTVQQLLQWINSAFITAMPIQATTEKLKAFFVKAIKTGPGITVSNISSSSKKQTYEGYEPLHIQAATADDAKTGSRRLKIRIRCHSMDLAAELVQDLAKFLNISDLETSAEFPDELEKFEEILKRVEDCNSARVRLAVDMADDSQRVKALIIRAEDSRIMADMPTMRRAYTDLFTTNSQLIGGYNVRASNHEVLLAALKDVNLMIQRAANLRIGKPKASVIAACRAAVKANNFASLSKIIRNGSDK